MELGLDGKRALVTAASGGLGFATARALAEEGARVAICSRDAGRAEDAARRIGQAGGGEARGYRADVAVAGDLERLFDRAADDLGGLDILVCNAGGPPPGDFGSLEEAEWDRAYALTLQSVVRSVQLALPHLRASGGGSILAIVSSSVRRPLPSLVLSNVFRPAVQGLCKTLSLQLAEEAIRVNCIAPGRVGTRRVDEIDEGRARKRGTSFEAVRAESLAEIPLGRLGELHEFGQVAAFLCSDAAGYVTGSTVLVDGGAVRCL